MTLADAAALTPQSAEPEAKLPAPNQQFPLRVPLMEGKQNLRLPMPLIITIGNLKGGVGKTTSAFFIACYFALVYGLRVLVIDSDPLSQTGYSWYRAIVKAGMSWPFKLIPFPSKHVGDCIDDNSASGDYDVIIVDTGGESDEIFKAAVRKSHELIIAAAPTEGELERIPSSFVAAAEAAQGVPQEIRVRVLLTKVPPPQSKEGPDARVQLDEAGYDVFEAQATNWKWYRQAVKTTNPMDDLSEYEDIGDELVIEYIADAA
ncbi:ParA family protein [Streptosporangium lutulentum]|uniref:Cellulose biosynthesis protein BcsQ n=1 Tax=Streptosporangium lutulentum TaxID=1461250 RepID=A0ABT9QU03_9ACTN|nr:ParA family protein [Streptosporangium lutulentum]MDP9850240.1 cellulose biosynthesis protein BcsQ [Streptosporangium lutulentum]